MKLTTYVYLSFTAAVFAAIVGYRVQGYWQSLLVNLATMFLGLALGLIIINHFLNRKEKRAAAVPMLEMIAPSISELHNEHLIEPCHLKFGIPAFGSLINAYQENRRHPEALSPQQRNGLYEIIKEHRDQLLPLMNLIHDQMREMTSLLGWSFSPRIVTVSMRVRLAIVKFKAIQFDDTDKTKLEACKLFLDIDGMCNTVLSEITGLMGLAKEDWISDSKH